MDEALALARAGLGTVWPNPSVGCLVVADGTVVGRGSTQLGGRPHAEVVAVEEAGSRAAGATAVVSLEPCCHYGQTPPCTKALIEAKIARVIVAIEDPDPRVNGAGISELERAGIQVVVGVRASEAREVNAGFFNRVRTGRPLVIVDESAERWSPDAVLGGDVGTVQAEITRADETWEVAGDAATMLTALGDRGLTRVFVRRDTALADAVMSAGLVDRR